jgi:hypothetical protein
MHFMTPFKNKQVPVMSVTPQLKTNCFKKKEKQKKDEFQTEKENSFLLNSMRVLSKLYCH